MGFRDRIKDAAAKGQELAAETAERARRGTTGSKAEESSTPQAWPTPATPPAWPAPTHAKRTASPQQGPILRVTSHDEGRNAIVSVYPDRIERVKEKAFGALSRARQDTEVIPMRSVSSVQARKKGIRTNVTVYASGNTIDFRIAHDEAQRFKDAITELILSSGAPPSTPSAVSGFEPDLADQIRKLAQLRDEGLLSDEQFERKKSQLLGF